MICCGRSSGAPGAGDDEGDGHLVEEVVLLADHRDVGDAGHLAADVLHLAGRHVLATDLERVLVAIAEVEVAVGRHASRCRRS